MKKIMFVLLFLGMSSVPSLAIPQDQQENSDDVSSSFGDAGYFYDSLSPYGEWLQLDAGFYAWRPSHIRPDWRPYLYGRWAWTDNGWYWNSTEPFGWAVYHYGRWYYDDTYGWVWIPNRTWGPAWVEWRYNDDYIGWAPLPPYACFNYSIGIRFTTHWFAPYHYWSFVRYRYITSPYVVREVVPLDFSRRLIGMTRSAGRYDYEGGRIINRGLDRGFVERRGGFTRIERTDIRDASSPGERYVRDNNRDHIDVYRPDRSATFHAPQQIDARQIDRRTSLDLQRIERAPRQSSGVQPSQPAVRDSRPQREAGRVPQGQNPQSPQAALPPRQRQDQRLMVPRQPSAEQRQLERRSDDRYPFPRQEQVAPPRERRVAPVQRSPQIERRVVPQQRARVEQNRPSQNVRKESPQKSEQSRRDGGRKRN